MSTIEDLQKIHEYQEYSYRNPGKESLLEKYRIPIQHFDFDYVNRCKDANELEKIIDVLRSGQEGYYPDLLRATEGQLAKLRPNSKCLRQRCRVLNKNDLEKDELDKIANDLNKWVANVSKCNRELEERKSNKTSCNVKIRQPQPQCQPLNLVKKENARRISSTDYGAWDRYDPDTEILKQDLEEERRRQRVRQARIAEEKTRQDAETFTGTRGPSATPTSTFVMASLEKRPPKKSVTFNRHPTEAEAWFLSERELEKGREFFKNGDYEMAWRSFSNSIASRMNVTNLNNRAVTSLKLKKYSEALEDCEQVLAIDSKNLKAQLRKAQALEGLQRYEDALDAVMVVIERDPNNSIAQELAERTRKHCRNVLKNTRLTITEIE
ncbi:spag1 axonemal dynein assembly factor [Rhynchophorus ferrugineus]|uniref:spag1 axonemal dynein assembly factor n=1 Tax=Rhynchophorus ferrugineus TaxID=354439 RepID=UPI003FCCB4A4